jgi:putative ATPase
VDQLFQPEEPEEARPEAPSLDGPLAARMRPRTLDDFVGQEHLLAPGSALRTAIESGRPHSMVLYGPPGTGKTTLARMTAEHADAAFEELSAVNAGRPEVREVIARARERQRSGRATIFFLDEIHRFNKAQQDALLPAVEEGLITRDDREPVLRGQLGAALPHPGVRAARARGGRRGGAAAAGAGRRRVR